MKEILLIVPSHDEVAYFSPLLKKHEINTLVCGTGPVLSLLNTLSFFYTKALPDVVILAGIAGAILGTQLKKGDVTIAKSERFIDIGRCTRKKIREIAATPKVQTKFYLKKNWKKILGSDIIKRFQLKEVNMGTVCCTSSSYDRIKMLPKDVLVENMEGASLALVCNSFDIPLIEIRGISNYLGERRSKWQIKLALENTREILDRLLSSI